MAKSAHEPGWSSRQCTMFFIACNAAGWNSAHRYMVMNHCGCPLDSKTKRPSVKHPNNTNRQLEMAMSFAEPVARSRGKSIRPPSKYKSWQAAAEDRAGRMRSHARLIISEATRRAPGMFDEGLESYVVEHVCSHDHSGFMESTPESIDQCDPPTIHKVIECLRAYVGRRFVEAGMNAQSFSIPKSARERAARRTR
ncbi:hypothetical protein COB72_03355 [bacterium]|nr:MAG: hypothetical protein COB72_03355 [bacterium]